MRDFERPLADRTVMLIRRTWSYRISIWGLRLTSIGAAMACVGSSAGRPAIGSIGLGLVFAGVIAVMPSFFVNNIRLRPPFIHVLEQHRRVWVQQLADVINPMFW